MGCNRRLRENYILILVTKSLRTLFELLGFWRAGSLHASSTAHENHGVQREPGGVARVLQRRTRETHQSRNWQYLRGVAVRSFPAPGRTLNHNGRVADS